MSQAAPTATVSYDRTNIIMAGVIFLAVAAKLTYKIVKIVYRHKSAS